MNGNRCQSDRLGCLCFVFTIQKIMAYSISTIPAKPISSEMLKSAGYFFSGGRA